MIERICVFTAREPQQLPQFCIKTVRHHHPRAEIVHVTDQDTPQLRQSDTVWRGEWDGSKDKVPLLRLRLLAANLDDRPTLMLDSDILLCRALDRVFMADFDVALTWRRSKISRYNAGVMFSRRAAFWQAFLRRMTKSKRNQTWNQEQVVLDAEAFSRKWKVLELPCVRWNCSDLLDGEPVPEAYVLHYKGPRKHLMRRHYRMGIWRGRT